MSLIDKLLRKAPKETKTPAVELNREQFLERVPESRRQLLTDFLQLIDGLNEVAEAPKIGVIGFGSVIQHKKNSNGGDKEPMDVDIRIIPVSPTADVFTNAVKTQIKTFLNEKEMRPAESDINIYRIQKISDRESTNLLVNEPELSIRTTIGPTPLHVHISGAGKPAFEDHIAQERMNKTSFAFLVPAASPQQ